VGRPLGSLHGAGGGRCGSHGAATREEEVALDRLGRKRKKRLGWAAWAERPNMPAVWLGQLVRNLKRNPFRNKN
jgi:hypothetical protein